MIGYYNRPDAYTLKSADIELKLNLKKFPEIVVNVFV